MQLFVLMMVMGLLFVADGLGPAAPALDGWSMAAASLAPYLPLALLGWALCRLALRRLRTRPQRAAAILNRLHRSLSAVRWLMLVVFLASVLVLGWRAWLVDRLGAWVLVNDLIALAPPLAAVCFLWWAFYPIDRRLREQTLLRHLDSGRPIFSFHTRGQFVVEQVRHQLLIVLVPMLLIVAWVQTADRLLAARVVGETAHTAALAGGGLTVFLLAPVLIRYLWRTRPMPDGSLRQRLLAMCARHRVRVAELLLWRTHAGLINGAVVGLVAPLRYILLTDGLIDRLDETHVEAVMAHELGHVRRRHMPWLAVCALATLGALVAAVEAAVHLVDRSPALGGLTEALDPALFTAPTSEMAGLVGAMLLVMAGWAAGFGYISRRFERQADTFAVQHLTVSRGGTTITDEAVRTMSEALRAVCRENLQPTSRKSWRHGSIDWRVDYLRSLVGRPVDACPIDRHVKLICWACAALFAATLAARSLH